MLFIPIHPIVIAVSDIRRAHVSRCAQGAFREFLCAPRALPAPVTKGNPRKVYVPKSLMAELAQVARTQGVSTPELARRILDHARPANWDEEVACAAPGALEVVVRVQVPERLGAQFTPELLCAGLALLEHTPFTAASTCPPEATYTTSARMPAMYARWYRESVLDNRCITTAALELALAQEQRTPACGTMEST